MGDVVSIESRKPHSTGPARCLHCKHEFVLVGPIGQCTFECPACGLSKAVRVGVCSVPLGNMIWSCGCGNEFFSIILEDGPAKALCIMCGQSTTLAEIR